MSLEDVVVICFKLDMYGLMLFYWFEEDLICRVVKFEVIDVVFNEDGIEWVMLKILFGFGYFVFIGYFVDEEGYLIC